MYFRVATVRRHWVLATLFACGIGLLCLNGIGQLLSLRNSDVYGLHEGTPMAATLDYPTAREQLQRKAGENDRDFAVRVTGVVNGAMAHYWKDEGIDAFNLRVPIWENHLFWIAGLLWPERFRRWEFADIDKALERGVGLCSQHAIILNQVLWDNGIESHIVSLGAHVVVTARVAPRDWYLLDADYGVVLPHNLNVIANRPELIRPYYFEQGYKAERVAILEATYRPEKNRIFNTANGTYILRYRGWERLFYLGIWVLPALLMLPFVTVAVVAGWRRTPTPAV